MSPFGEEQDWSRKEESDAGIDSAAESAVRNETRLDEAVKQRNGELINGRLFAKAGIAKTGSKANIRMSRIKPTGPWRA
jgi:hypothetical protein